MATQSEELEKIILKCLEANEKTSREKCDADEAERIAAFSLFAQIKVSSLIEELEFRSKNSKNEISRLEADAYFIVKTNSADKKFTEAAIAHSVAKDPSVVAAKQENAKYESEFKKWNYLMSVLKEQHIYYRNLGKTKSWNE